MVNDDTTRSLVDAYNDLREYLRKLVLLIPGADTFTPDLLPDRIEQQEDSPAASWPPEEVIPLPRTQVVDEGYMLGAGTTAESDIAAFTANYKTTGAETTEAFWTLEGVKYCALMIALDVRRTGDVAGLVPDDTTPGTGGSPAGMCWGNAYFTWDGALAEWFELAYTFRDDDLAFEDAVVTSGQEACSGLQLQARITDEGSLELRVNNTSISSNHPLCIAGTVWIIRYPQPTSGEVIFFGNGQ